MMGKRKAASMVNVIVFMVASVMIITHIFFFSVMSAETNALQVKAMQNRFKFDHALDTVIADIENGNVTDHGGTAPKAAFKSDDNIGPSFHEATRLKDYDFSDNIHACVYDLHYSYVDYSYATNRTGKNWSTVDKHMRVFSPIHADGNARYFLIRIYRISSVETEKKSMHQVLVKRTGSSSNYTVKTLSFKEVWYE